MKVLIVLPGGVHPSGEVDVIPVLLGLSRALSKQHRVFIIALNQHDRLTEYCLHGCQVISLPNVGLRNIWYSFTLVVKRLKHYNFTPDIIHSFWLGHTTLFAGFLRKKYKVPLVATIAGGEPVSIKNISYGGSQRIKSRLINWFGLKLAHTTTCGSGYIQNLIKQRWRVRSHLIPLGIDSHLWPMKKCAKQPNKQWQLLQLASINKVKSPYLMLNIVRILKQLKFDFHLNWIGVDTLNGEIQRQARLMGVSNDITFHGFKTQTQLKGIFKNQHFAVQTSVYESQGIAMVEACSQGCCLVGTNVGWLHDMGFGVTVEKNKQAAAIAEEIMLLAGCQTKRKERVQLAQKWIAENELAITTKKFNDIYSSYLN